ncbi:MAG: beta-propeller fold lactonase family protein [Gemmatimonadales bacterium]
MRHSFHLQSFAIATAAVLGLAACSDQTTSPVEPALSAARGVSSSAAAGGVYTSTNGTGGNAIVAFSRAANGSLTSLGSFSTGGTGTGGTVDPLASQYAILLSDDNKLLFAVNAGSDDVSSFRVESDASLTLLSRQSSGGDRPVSLTQDGSLLYVLNAGDNTVTGLRISGGGKLVAIPNSTRSLASGAAGASTIGVSPNGKYVLVTERGSNRIETFAVSPNGRLEAPVVTASSGAVPFGFDFTASGHPIITEAGGAVPNGAVSSYSIGTTGSLSTITASLDAGGAASCWVILTADSRYAFVANSASNTIASVAVSSNATLTLLNAVSVNTGPNTTPIDVDLTEGDGFLFTLEARSGRVTGFLVGAGATLTAIGGAQAGPGSGGLQGVAAY